MLAFYADQFVLPLPAGHRFPMGKYRMLRDRLATELPDVRMTGAPRASAGELALAHTPAYIHAITSGSVAPEVMREIGFPWSEAMAERACRSVGATIGACRAALGTSVADEPRRPGGLAANLAGGTHHAYADKGGGFCVFNDAVVAARLMQAEHLRPRGRQAVSTLPLAQGAKQAPLKVAIIDLDVHQGNGTASLCRHDPSIFTLSLHGEKNFPFRKEASDLDVNLPDGCTDEPYLQALEHALDELARRFDPGLVIYLAGADPFEGDRLGRLKLSCDGLEARDRRVFDWAWQRRVPLAFCMAGGYGVRMEDTVQVQMNTWRVALEYWRRWHALPA